MTRLQDDVDRLKVELELRQQLWRLQEDAKRPAWVHAAPWIALAVVAICFTVGWSRVTQQEQERLLKKFPDPATVSDLTAGFDALETAVRLLHDRLERTSGRVEVLTAKLDHLLVRIRGVE